MRCVRDRIFFVSRGPKLACESAAALGYHKAHGHYELETGTGGTPRIETRTHDDGSWALGAGLKGGVHWTPSPGWSIGVEGGVSFLPDRTVFVAPANPDEQADAGFRSEDMTRWHGTFRVMRSF